MVPFCKWWLWVRSLILYFYSIHFIVYVCSHKKAPNNLMLFSHAHIQKKSRLKMWKITSVCSVVLMKKWKKKKQDSQSFRGHWIASTLIVSVIHSPHKSRHATPPYIICIYNYRWYWLCTNLVSHAADLNPCLCFWTHFCCFQVARVWTVMPLSLCRGRCKI